MEWKFKEGLEPQGGSDGFWYDLTDGGYIRPEELLADQEQVKKIKDAVDLIQSFEQALVDAELLNNF